MKKPCTQCAHPTIRHDNLCPNCYYASSRSINPQSIGETAALGYGHYTCECGESNPRVLILMCKGGPGLQAGAPRSDRAKPRDSRAILVTYDPSLWYACCYNCNHKATTRSPGRPKKYTDEQRKWNRINYSKVYKANLNTKVILSYGTRGSWPHCVACDEDATRVLYIGEFGKAPLGNQYWSCRRLAITPGPLKDYWHNQFAPYCANHEVMNLGARNAYKKQLFLEELATTNYKASRTFEELQRAGEV